jgi:hypothetical protein
VGAFLGFGGTYPTAVGVGRLQKEHPLTGEFVMTFLTNRRNYFIQMPAFFPVRHFVLVFVVEGIHKADYGTNNPPSQA